MAFPQIFNNIANVFQPKLWGTLGDANEEPSGKTAFSYDLVNDADVVTQDFGGITASEYAFSSIPTEEIDLITKYRNMILDAEVGEAFGEIVNEIFVFNEGKRPVALDFSDSCKLSDAVKAKITDEFDEVYNLLDFNNRGLEWFQNWYVDSKLIFHKVIDPENPGKGIQELMRIDPLAMRKVRQLPRPDSRGLYDPSGIQEFYVYTPSAIQNQKKGLDVLTLGWNAVIHGLKISPANITFVDSGEYNQTTGRCVGYLYKTIAPLNQLRGMEDVMMIFRLARAPSRRAFYVDLGSMGKTSGESYMQRLARTYGSRMVYDPGTGGVINKKSVMSITEDYWLPRREGKGTEVQNIDGQDTSNVIEEVKYYKDRFYASLSVPRSRFNQDQSTFNFGRGVEIDRDEYRFTKFIAKLRQRFMRVFLDILHTNLVLKGVIEKDEWSAIQSDIVWKFGEDNNFVEWKKAEVLGSRLATMRDAADLIGKYVSSNWAAKNILKMTDEEIREEKKQMKKEAEENAANGVGQEGDFGGAVNIPDTAGEEPVQTFVPAQENPDDQQIQE